jgi:hypothetical protein
MTRNLRPALPAFLLLLSAVGLGVPASSAQSKGTAKKKPTASKATATAKSSAEKASAGRAAAGNKASKAPADKSSSLRKSASGVASPKSPARGAASSRKRTSSRSRRQPGQKTPTSDRVSEIQAALAKDGSFAGMPNGKWDDETAAAMRRFQAAHGLNPTGKLDALSLQKLGLGSQTAGVAAPTPPPGAVSRLTSSVIAPASATETARRQ